VDRPDRRTAIAAHIEQTTRAESSAAGRNRAGNAGGGKQ